MNPEDDKSSDQLGTYVMIGKNKRGLLHHPTDFTVGSKPSLAELGSLAVDVSLVSAEISRVTAGTVEQREELMTRIQKEKKCAIHHVYHLEDTKEELVIGDRIYLTLFDDSPESLKSILDRFTELEWKKRIGRTHVLHVTDRTNRNPLKIANQIAMLKGVERCTPMILPRVSRHSTHGGPKLDLAALSTQHKLFERQWHLFDSADAKGASINVQRAWGLIRQHNLGDGTGFGDPDVVIAVIDDGFDVGLAAPPANIGHPIFFGKVLHKAARNLGDGDPGVLLGERDFHGTPVASIATGSLLGNGMLPVAPSCGFLPIRIALNSNIDLEMVLEALQIASDSANIVNCSFGLVPSSLDVIGENAWFFESVAEMARTGGKRGKGLVIVFGAGNDDAPTFLSAERNISGIRFPIESSGGALQLGEIKKEFAVHSGFPEIPGVVVVSAMSSLRRKAGYSNWGPHVTVAAPSDNGHDMTRLLDPVFDAANGYPGRGLIAAVNQAGHGASSGALFGPMDAQIQGIAASQYTESFGRTSGAAPIVAGVAALMLSANGDLSAADVVRILRKTADKNLDFTLDLENDPNLQGSNGMFDGKKHSHFFGAGKVDAGNAVQVALKEKLANATVGSPNPTA